MVIGSVTTHAIIIFWAIPHFTALILRALPTPITDVVITCVVLIGAPRKDMLSITTADAV